MRSPSHLRTRVSRAVALRAALGAMLSALVLVPAVEAAPGDRGVFVSNGVGRVVFAGGPVPSETGPGTLYGTIFSGGSLTVSDYSVDHDLKVDTPVVPTINLDGSRTYTPPPSTTKKAVGVGFRISGSVYRITVTGSSRLNAVGVYGEVQLRGKGTLTVNGKKSRWNLPAIKLGKVPKAVKPLYRLAAANAPLPAPPAPPPVPPVPTTPTTTTTGTSGG